VIDVAQTDASRRSSLSRVAHNPQALVGALVLLVVVGIAVLGPAFAPHTLDEPIGIPASGPAPGAPLGTDMLGRDVLSRVLNGGESALAIAAITTALTYVLGIAVGLTAGLSRSLLDPLLMRTVDVFLVFPPLMLILLLIAGAGSSTPILVGSIVLVLFPGVARLVRTATLEISTTAYIEAAVARGERMLAIMHREVLPNIVPSIVADLGVRFSAVVVLAASINFLGLGSKPPAANWGLMIAENLSVIATSPWAVLVPAVLLALLTVSVNLLGDAFTRNR
jgi:peptide/nickel transport system permease protein